MAEEQPSLHIDTDWKKQAQEEKKRLAETLNKANPNRGPSVGLTGRARSARIHDSAAARASGSALASIKGIDHADGGATVCRGPST